MLLRTFLQKLVNVMFGVPTATKSEQSSKSTTSSENATNKRYKRCVGHKPSGIPAHITEVSQFANHSRSKDGLKNFCKSCSKAMNALNNPKRDRAKYTENEDREKAIEESRLDPECPVLRAEISSMNEYRVTLNRVFGNVTYHIDHITPLLARKEIIRGMHVPWNMRLMRAEDNTTRDYDEIYKVDLPYILISECEKANRDETLL